LGAGQPIEVFAPTNFSGTTAMDLTGNALAQQIAGNNGNNLISDGGVGAPDVMTGYAGNDTYPVANAGDIVNEAASGGTDRVNTSVSYTLGAGQSIELFAPTSFSSTTAINFTGNALVQTIGGDNGDNIIDGKGGND